ncbi:conserved phage C-terminal domain-containing protein [Clostridium sardiniense]|uniref:Conserved phage C-terminal domain-containing protein n=1 Tax=Clostridium sardiniense TaxID=29369 RepID=A0ABS7KTH6_CLOSR|nr:conserved phage C-terminal domain-containing protein [Clostridium sardiniense]MBY0754070.1 conserved phage C-terminal domain-containing protein [Clostridium sardiniense]MDQ0459409.1 putative phage protein (TIGR02220 family) [Clostridium sardiniense]
MQNILIGYSQEKAVEFGLDLKDLIILRFICTFIISKSIFKKKIDGRDFYWIKTSYIIEQLPLLNIKSKDMIMRRVKKLVENKLLDYRLMKEGGTYTLYAIGSEYENLFFKNDKDSLRPKGDDKNLGGGSEFDAEGDDEKSVPKNTNAIDTKEKDNKKIYKKKICKEIIDFLNEKLDTNYKSITKTTVRLIEGRLDEGYTVDDFKKVIENKKKSWKGTKYEAYLRPSTLFRESKFEEYLNEKVYSRVSVPDEIFKDMYSEFDFDI